MFPSVHSASLWRAEIFAHQNKSLAPSKPTNLTSKPRQLQCEVPVSPGLKHGYLSVCLWVKHTPTCGPWGPNTRAERNPGPALWLWRPAWESSDRRREMLRPERERSAGEPAGCRAGRQEGLGGSGTEGRSSSFAKWPLRMGGC